MRAGRALGILRAFVGQLQAFKRPFGRERFCQTEQVFGVHVVPDRSAGSFRLAFSAAITAGSSSTIATSAAELLFSKPGLICSSLLMISWLVIGLASVSSGDGPWSACAQRSGRRSGSVLRRSCRSPRRFNKIHDPQRLSSVMLVCCRLAMLAGLLNCILANPCPATCFNDHAAEN